MTAPEEQQKTIGIPLFGKGGTNHLHRQEIIDEFARNGWRVTFWVRSDYMDLIELLPGCSYKEFPKFSQKEALKQSLLDLCKHIRYQYPGSDPWRQWHYKTLNQMTPRLRTRLFRIFVHGLSRFHVVMLGIVAIEGWIWRKRIRCSFLMEEKDFDCLLVLGVGTAFDEMGPAVTWWAYMLGIPVIHFIANYDHISSKGFRAHPVKKLLVWGRQMREDAIKIQKLPASKVFEIGSLRYNLIPPATTRSKEQFLQMSGLASDAKTVMFAGSAYDFHYFEMIAAFDELKRRSRDKLQLVMRVYPNRYLLQSAYMHTILKYLEMRKDVWLSIADPNHNAKNYDEEETLKIEENELWYMLQFCDVVVNIFSTLTIEACIFDKPVINMWYFPKVARALKQPIYHPYPLTQHIRRVMASGAAELAENRSQLLGLMANALRDPAKRRIQRKKLVDMECGLLDGRAVEKLVLNCMNEVSKNDSIREKPAICKEMKKTISYFTRKYIKSQAAIDFLDRRNFKSFSQKDLKRLEFYSKIIKPGDLVFDVGANVGNRLKIFLNLGAKVVAFEPQEECATYLQRMLKRERNFILCKKALDNQEAVKTMFVSEINVLSSLSKEWINRTTNSGRFKDVEWGKKIKVATTTLDKSILLYGMPSFIKIDVEGYEYNVVTGLTRIVDCISIEFTPEYIENAFSCVDYLDKLYESAEYQLSIGESMEFYLEKWVSSTSIKNELLKIDKRMFGDIYIRKS